MSHHVHMVLLILFIWAAISIVFALGFCLGRAFRQCNEPRATAAESSSNEPQKTY